MSNHNPFSLRIGDLSQIRVEIDSGRLPNSAAVLLLITDEGAESTLLYTRRADHLNSHSGQVSFPGGRWEEEDTDLSVTALRETHEEVGIHPELVSLCGSLTARPAKNGMHVQPYVGKISSDSGFVANPDEIAEIFQVPLRYFMTNKPSRIDVLSRNGLEIRMPAWNFDGQDIWGLSALFTMDLLKRMKIHPDLEGVRLNFREPVRSQNGR